MRLKNLTVLEVFAPEIMPRSVLSKHGIRWTSQLAAVRLFRRNIAMQRRLFRLIIGLHISDASGNQLFKN